MTVRFRAGPAWTSGPVRAWNVYVDELT